MEDPNRDRVVFDFYEPKIVCVKRLQSIGGSDRNNKSEDHDAKDTDLKQRNRIKSVNQIN